MTKRQSSLCEALKRLGFKQDSQMKLYGEEFELLSDPMVVRDHLVFVDAIEKKSGRFRRVRVPLTIMRRIDGEDVA